MSNSAFLAWAWRFSEEFSLFSLSTQNSNIFHTKKIFLSSSLSLAQQSFPLVSCVIAFSHFHRKKMCDAPGRWLWYRFASLARKFFSSFLFFVYCTVTHSRDAWDISVNFRPNAACAMKKCKVEIHLNSLESLAVFLLISRMVSMFSKFCGSPTRFVMRLDNRISSTYYYKEVSVFFNSPRRLFVATNLLGAFDIVYMIAELSWMR